VRRWLIPALLAVAVVAGAAALLALSRSGEAGRPTTEREGAIRPTARADIEPNTHRFGETVRARLELVVPTDQLDAQTLRVGGSFDPYDVVATPERSLVQVGPFTVARYEILLRCVKEECLPGEQTQEFTFPPAGFSWKVPAPPGRRFVDRRLDERRASASVPPLTVARGVSSNDLREGRWRSSLGALPEPDMSISPRRLEALLLGAAVALVAAAAILVAFWLHRELRRRGEPQVVPELPPDSLEQALRLLESADGDRDPAQRRLALETLAAELRGADQAGLAEDAERLAWAEHAPRREAVSVLAATVRERVDGSRS
jgi:hypothetical protein